MKKAIALLAVLFLAFGVALAQETYVITTGSNIEEGGTVLGGGTYHYGDTATLRAIPNEYYDFICWNDGLVTNPRDIIVTQDAVYKAYFSFNGPKYTITVVSNDPTMGIVDGGGEFPINSTIDISATPYEGDQFDGWSDGDMSNPRAVTVTDDATYLALFSEIPTPIYTVTVYYEEGQGLILGANTTYPEGATATIVAIPADGYVFVNWSDGVTDNRREILVDHDIELTAYFNYTDLDESGTQAVSLYPNPANDKLHIDGLDGRKDVRIYNTMGMLVKTTNFNGTDEISVSELPVGIYLIRIDGRHMMKFVKK